MISVELRSVERICRAAPQGSTEMGVLYSDVDRLAKAMKHHTEKIDFDPFLLPPEVVQYLIFTYELDLADGYPVEASSILLIQDARFIANSFVEGPFRYFPTTLN